MFTDRMSTSGIAPSLAGNVLGSATDDFLIAEWEDPGGVSDSARLIAPLHRHNEDDEAWYVLEGVLHIQMDDDVIELRAGAGVLVKRGTAHTYWNPGPGRTRYLLTMTPRIYLLIEAIHSLDDRTEEALKQVFAEHNSELL